MKITNQDIFHIYNYPINNNKNYFIFNNNKLFMLKNIIKRNNYPNIILNMKHIVFDLEDMKLTFEKFKYKLFDLQHIEPGDKISFDVDLKVYLDKGNILQSVKRWYYGENRDITYQHLSSLFEDYEKYLKMVIKSIFNPNVNTNYYNHAKTINEYNMALISGLVHLRNTYQQLDCEKVYSKVKQIIDMMNTFNNKFRNCTFSG